MLLMNNVMSVPPAPAVGFAADYTDEESRWAAIERRDPQADGHFYYGVRTTGVYCRPSCSAKRARRENVAFFMNTAEAERAGFRPCKRCRPNETTAATPYARAVEMTCRTLDAAQQMPKLSELAAQTGFSTFHFHRVFRAQMGLTPREYFAAQRARRIREQLRESGTVTDALYAAGFSSSSRFYERSNEMLGMHPKVFQSGGAGTRIRFAVGQCSLGAVLVAATDKGVCSVFLGDDPQKLVRDLEDHFPKAELIGVDREFEEWVAKVVACVDHPSTPFDLPLDVQGTAFQQRVWRALREIPPGTTVSYQQLAAAIGTPKAARAVARACAANPVAVAIPCHRVVRRNGDISGYRWGVERKRWLLTQESPQ